MTFATVTPTGVGIHTAREQTIRCRTCGATTEDLLDDTYAPGEPVSTWCHRCDDVTDQEILS